MQGFQWLQLVIIDGYGTIHGCHMHWSSQNGLENVLEPEMMCTILPGTDCICILSYLIFIFDALKFYLIFIVGHYFEMFVKCQLYINVMY